MTRWFDWGFKRMNTNVLHVYTECPEGKIIAIAKRDGVKTNDPEAMKGQHYNLVMDQLVPLNLSSGHLD
jgi:hypothetical protein